jgi:hypothetical protein
MNHVDAGVMRHPPRRTDTVAGHKHGNQPGSAQLDDGLEAVGLECIPELTALPSRFSTGMRSPVINDWSTPE